MNTVDPEREPDTQAILKRRRFLIEATLAGVGLGAAVAGIAAVPVEVAQPCLSIMPDATRPTSLPSTLPATKPTVCLDVLPPPGRKPLPPTQPAPQAEAPPQGPPLDLGTPPKPIVCLWF